jgi:hypothetical protein
MYREFRRTIRPERRSEDSIHERVACLDRVGRLVFFIPLAMVLRSSFMSTRMLAMRDEAIPAPTDAVLKIIADHEESVHSLTGPMLLTVLTTSLAGVLILALTGATAAALVVLGVVGVAVILRGAFR